jgi:hypothetical protein
MFAKGDSGLCARIQNQVSVRYIDDRPVSIDTVVVSSAFYRKTAEHPGRHH